mmetsp:Transcript_28389/g.73920  ORF Transcript_28389/g.73920 Transcript_28389/m.73920 type:complete len:103 (-) Transcript_28389:74-382(-)
MRAQEQKIREHRLPSFGGGSTALAKPAPTKNKYRHCKGKHEHNNQDDKQPQRPVRQQQRPKHNKTRKLTTMSVQGIKVLRSITRRRPHSRRRHGAACGQEIR